MTVGYRATTVVNFGHGDVVMIGAYTMLVLVTGAGLPFPVALAIAAVALFGFGYLTQRGLMAPISTGPHLSLAIMALAIGYALRGIARTQWGNETLLLPALSAECVHVRAGGHHHGRPGDHRQRARAPAGDVRGLQRDPRRQGHPGGVPDPARRTAGRHQRAGVPRRHVGAGATLGTAAASCWR